jgi:hypothetical protein
VPPSFLTPAARPANPRSFDEIRSRYRELQGAGLAAAQMRAPVRAVQPDMGRWQ